MENRRLSASIARKILRMLEGETLPSSTLPSWIAQELLEEGLLSVLSRGSRKSYRLIDAEACMRYIGNRYTGGATLSRWIELAEGNEELNRGVLVRETGYSRLSHYAPSEASWSTATNRWKLQSEKTLLPCLRWKKRPCSSSRPKHSTLKKMF